MALPGDTPDLSSTSLMVETPRLLIIPLSYQQLYLYIQAEGRLEKELLLKDNGRVISPDVKEVVTRFTLPNMQQARNDHYLFFTFWLVVEKSARTIVAELGFKGAPDKKGAIEIGYGTVPAERGKGYMTEAVGEMIEWARGRPDLEYILAETDEKNSASIRIVQKNNFRQYKRKGKMLWWHIRLR
jgi:[ribosomal protein S5]-alanine N-acetyltransferase